MILKGSVTGGYINIDRKVRFRESVLAKAINANPWGTARYVDASDGSAAFNGLTPDKAHATIAAAVALAGRGDTIYIRPKPYVIGTGFGRYTEDVVTALIQSDLSIIGVINTINPQFGVRWKFATAQCLDNWAPGLHLENLGFFAEDATYGVLLTNDGASDLKRGSDGATIYNCDFKGKGLYVLSGGTGLTVERTRFTPKYSGAQCILLFSCSANPGRHLHVRDCEWFDANGGQADVAGIQIPAPATEILIRDCHFGLKPASGVYIDTNGDNYGMISNCYFNEADLDTDAEILLGTGVKAVGCYDQAGIATTA